MSVTDTSLSLLARVCVTGDAVAWDRVTQIYSPLLSAWLREMGVQPADTDDLVQDILLVLSRELKNFEHNGRPGAFRTWLRRIMVNRARDFWRSQQYRPTAIGGSVWAASLEALADDNSAASREWEQEHDRQVIERLLLQIQPRFAANTWEAFHRQVILGQQADQVATELGMPISSVYVARSRILNALRSEAAGLVSE
jgi:RNA polymerase sigma-70 factor, ECF subfamily